MTTPVEERAEKAAHLKVYKMSDGQYLVDSSGGKVCYKVTINDGVHSCTCGDFAKNQKTDPAYACKHLIAAFNGEAKSTVKTVNINPRLDERFLMNIKGKEFVKYAGLLDLAHQKGLTSMSVTPLQYPTKDNGFEAICRAIIETPNGRFEEVGDATRANVNKMVSEHLLHMAATRAKARALRDYTNIGMTCLEEIGDTDHIIPEEEPKPQARPKPALVKPSSPAKKTEKSPEQEKPAAKEKPVEQEAPPKQEKQPEHEKPPVENPKPASQGDRPKMSEAQLKAIHNLARRRGIKEDELQKMAMETFGVNLDTLNGIDASSFIRNLQQAA